ncbi:Carnitine O-acetyltransferase, mitochondrial [Hondaea fermentalgiana]|uniref:Carnitine O-acetyltransferase, mitochondrial n=1 Tax=Hondaea fermentalgiana TaxID=2315210 RepID=A0A2R5G2J9_9STRA|nr:Carnitine O-acetyltransferase, mitochondrial [Hondaea fermentalgiana]|eukprot:GBG24765.1 Carnitine O-acetyltransferase, mitochondrial [Hondaea fermentalgiana]
MHCTALHCTAALHRPRSPPCIACIACIASRRSPAPPAAAAVPHRAPASRTPPGRSGAAAEQRRSSGARRTGSRRRGQRRADSSRRLVSDAAAPRRAAERQRATGGRAERSGAERSGAARAEGRATARSGRGRMSKVVGYEKALFRDHGADFAESKDMEPASQTLYAKQGEVDPLPLPELEHTFELFLQSVKPHVTEAEYRETERKVREFAKEGGLAQELQKRLQALAEERKGSSWFIKMWNEAAYLGYRDSVVWNVTYYLQFKDELASGMASQTRRAARFVYHALAFRDELVSGRLTPDMGKKKAWSNSQYKYMFNASRMPGEDGMDFVRTYAPDVYNHIVVMRKNRFYTFDVQGLSVDDLHYQLERVKRMADREGTDYYPVGVLTAEDRDKWAAKRLLLTELGAEADGRLNAASLERIESSILCVNLEDWSPTTREETGLSLLAGNGRNRFWDKSMQFVFFENGKGGYVGEHAMMDGMTTTRLVNYCLDKVFADPPEVVSGANFSNSLLPEPEPVLFQLSQSAKAAIQEAEATFDAMLASKELSVCMFHGYGKNKIKTFKTSPDAFAQVAIQYAYYKTFGCCRGTYESTQTRTYMHGRTEVTRSVTNESVAFCQAMTSGGVPAKRCLELLRSATSAHSAYTKKASAGTGCDRHLLGLKMMMRDGESAELYSDAGYARSSTWALSTSGLGGELMDGWGFGEVVPHGLGIGYSVQNDKLRFTVSSRHPEQKWATRFTANMEAALQEMQAVVAMGESEGKL